MKEILLKFETEEDYIKFINDVVIPSVQDDQIEHDQENNIIIIKKLNNE